ncbi:hypothetical protein [Streptomyces triticisoli]|uniref:hypothetical protein n=1 Tax=Streptomyces triticisoli TaxID=2182797 RepID=UPI0013009AE0|nr:hypothetical protein [Streptomyces triticisoli]
MERLSPEQCERGGPRISWGTLLEGDRESAGPVVALLLGLGRSAEAGDDAGTNAHDDKDSGTAEDPQGGVGSVDASEACRVAGQDLHGVFGVEILEGVG